MDSREVFLPKLIGIIAIFLMLAGCAKTIVIKSADIPQLQTGSPLKSVKPKIFSFKGFKDIRGTDSYVMVRSGNYFPIALDRPAAAVTSMAIRKELERNGHKCVSNYTGSKSDLIIEGVVYSFGIIEDVIGPKSVTGNVVVKLTITPSFDSKRVFAKWYEGSYMLHSKGFMSNIPRKEYENILIKALLGMLRDMSTDPELVEFIGQ